IGFDLWETLITDTAELSREQERLRLTRMEAILTARGHAAEAVRIERAYRALWHRCLELYWSVDVDVPCRRQIEHFLEHLGLDPASFADEALDELELAYANAAVEVPPAIVAGADTVLPALRERGLRIGLISNTGRTPGYALREILRGHGLAEHIEVMVFSNEHGACKPQPSIFEELRRGLGVAYEEMMFVGDNLHVDVYGAQQCGIKAVHFEPPARGTAVAPPVGIEGSVVPDARITRLEEVIDLVDRLIAAA
ncbi:MAG TPA: HAD family hydrolase, partial [Thermoanaerobaculia bacterium]